MANLNTDPVPSLPPRPLDGHKGLFGNVLVVGGSHDVIGAPVFAAMAALRLGSGLVHLAVPHPILTACLTIVPEAVGLGLTGKIPADAIAKANAIVLGPGLGQSPRAKQWLAQLIAIEKPMVIDADALNIIAQSKRWPAKFRAQAVLTPHPGEMRRLAHLAGRADVPTDEPGRIDLASTAAKQWGVTIVLKGHRTVIADGNQFAINETGDSSLSKGGSGDILSGMVGCLLGQKMNPFAAARLATHLHGRAGELAGLKLGRRSVLARDVLDAISAAIAELESVV
jgi:ADP-dependent NAD(P)H-hydrate dehydratase